MTRLLLIVAALLMAQPALAQEDRHDLAVRAVEVGFEPQVAARIMDSYWPVAVELIKLRVPTLTEIQLFQYKGKTGIFAAEAAHATLAPLVEVLERGFTAAELEALIAFYASPAGIKLGGASGAIAAVMSGPVSTNLATEVATFQGRIDEMLTADGH